MSTNKSADIAFTNRAGFELAARRDLPENADPVGSILLAHCFTCSKDLNSLRRLAQTLTTFDFEVVSFDFTGLGLSGGDFTASNFTSQASDLIDAANFMDSQGTGPTVLVGHSLGGTAALYAAREIDGVRGVATIGSPAAPAHVEKLFGENLVRIESDGAAEVSIGGRPFTIAKDFLEDVRNHPPEAWLGDMRKELMILHSPTDAVVGIVNAERIFKAVKHPKSFVSLRDADHLLSRADDAAYAGRIIGAWARSFVEPAGS